jgi:hypothetical protein
MSESLLILHSMTLFEPLCKKTSFKPFNITIDMTLDFKHPLWVDNIHTRNEGQQEALYYFWSMDHTLVRRHHTNEESQESNMEGLVIGSEEQHIQQDRQHYYPKFVV